MRKGFTKLPNAILDQPWASNPTTVYLYTWLSLNADKEGNVMTSRADLAERTGLTIQQLRTALEKLETTKFVTKSSTKLPTKFATILTVEFLKSCKDSKSKNNQVNNQADNQEDNQPRAYKNDINIIMSIEDNNKNIISPDVEINTHYTARDRFIEWLSKECPFISSHYTLPSEREFEKLKTEYGSSTIAEMCLNIENRVDLRKRYSNLYRTLNNWLKNEKNGTHQHGNQQQPSAQQRQQGVANLMQRLANEDGGLH